MKFRILSTIVFVFLAGLTACTSQAVTPQPEGEAVEVTLAATEPGQAEIAPSETAAVDTQTEATATMDVEALILEKLQGHHSIQRVYAAEKTREEWNATLDRMIGYGAKISEEEKQIIIDYLLSR